LNRSALLYAAAAIGGAVIVFAIASRQSPHVTRCASSLHETSTRCCAEGQRELGGRCQGQPASCPDGFERKPGGCVVEPRRVKIPATDVVFSSTDWEAVGTANSERVAVAPFEIDAYEVTEDRWAACSARGKCRERSGAEPGQPVVDVSLEDAASFCRAEGGTLPTPQQFIAAAAGAEIRRYPWGLTGAVCRRLAWGRAAGPCGSGASEPELAGIFPEGATPDTKLHDLAGNVAEWTRSEDGTRIEVRGGSFRTEIASALRTWAYQVDVPSSGRDDVGFRCAYPSGPRSD
jgi:formylglycine-generating enzyme required for sulfatase activity